MAVWRVQFGRVQVWKGASLECKFGRVQVWKVWKVANLEECSLEGAVWEGAVPKGAVWKGAVWKGAVWKGMKDKRTQRRTMGIIAKCVQ